MATGEGITDAALDEVMPRPVEAGTLLFSFKLSIGRMGFAGRAMHHNEAIAALPVRDPGVLDREFLFYALRATTHEGAANHAVLGKVLNKRKVEQIEIPVPPLDEQRHIVAILNRAAKIERLRARAAESLREFVPALFVRMFGDPVDNPMRWPKEDLGGLVDEFRYGTSGKCNTEERPGDLPVLRIPNVVGGAIEWDGLKFRSFDGREAESLRLRTGDILFVRTNGNPNYIGRCAVFDGSRAAAFASYLIRARLGDSIVRPAYLTSALALPSMRRTILSLARTTAGNYNISIRSLASLVLPLPPLELQVQYERLENQARELFLRGEVAATSAATLSSSAMAKLLSSSDVE